MKIRLNFVSNSSSSSFVLSLDKNGMGEKCPLCKKTSISFINLVKFYHKDDNENSVDAHGFDEVVRTLMSDYYDVSHVIDLLIKEHADYPDRDICLVHISYDNATLRDVLSESDNIKIIAKID